MATRSNIIVHRADGKWACVYVNFDGYLSGVGRTLFDHYTTQEQVEKLIEPGDMSVLDARCEKPGGHSFDTPVKGYCIYYGRDRGETEVAPVIGRTLKSVWPAKDSWVEFVYVWHGGAWSVGDPAKGPTKIVPLGEALRGEKPVTPAIKALGMILGKHKAVVPE